MKQFKKMLLIITAVVIMISQSGCFGSFELTKAVYNVNENVGDKVVQEVVFLAFCIIPVYEVAVFVDAIVLNTIEFWTGSNPLAMNEGDIEIQEVESGNKLYQITATKNNFNVKQLVGPNAGEFVNLVYNPDTQIWSAQTTGVSFDVLQMLGAEKVKVFNPFGFDPELDITKMDKEFLLKNI